MLACCQCQETGFNRNTLEMHIATQHIFYNAYACEHCKTAQFPSEFALRQHYQQDHRQNVFYIRFRVSPDLDKKKDLLEHLIRKSLNSSNNGEPDGSHDGRDNSNINDTTPGFIPNIDHLDATQLLNCINAGSSVPSFSALLKYDIDDPEAEAAASSANETADFKTMINRNGDVITYGGQLSNYVNSTLTASGRIQAAAQSLLTMNGDQSTAQDGNSVTNHHTQQHPHFIQVQPAGSYSNGNNDGSGSNDSESMENGSDLLAKILNVTKQDHGNGIASTSRNNRSSPMSANGGTKRPGRVSSQVACIECGNKVSNYMNSLVLHVSTHHCDQPVYECLACNKQWFSLSARFKEHIKTRHEGDFSLLKDNRHEIMPTLRQKASQLFPDHRFA